MHLPVLALVAGAVGRLGRLGGQVVAGERVVPVDQPELALVLLQLEQVLHRGLGLGAVRALEVGELDDGDGRGVRPLRRPGGRDLDLGRQVGRQQHLHLGLGADLLEVLRQHRLALLAAQELGDLRLHLVEGLLHLAGRLGALVEGARLLVGRLADLGRQLGAEELVDRLAGGLGLGLHQPLVDELVERRLAQVVGALLDLVQLAADRLVELAGGDHLGADLGHRGVEARGGGRVGGLGRAGGLAGEDGEGERAEDDVTDSHVAPRRDEDWTGQFASSRPPRSIGGAPRSIPPAGSIRPRSDSARLRLPP